VTAIDMPSWSSALAAALRRPLSRRLPVILVVDDDRDTRELYRACFDMSGFVTAEASTGEEAIRVAERLLPDVMLTDLILPDIDGFTVVRRLKALRATAGKRAILLTGFGLNDFEQRAADAGASRALLKPCLPDVMLREVRRALKRLPEA
jgi:two-component system cell cycle response regulator DivK